MGALGGDLSMTLRSVTLDEIPEQHPVAVFHRFWSGIAIGGRWAPWASFDATQHPAILPWVLLLRRETSAEAGGSDRWRYTVCGTGCTALFGFSYQGKLFGEGLPPEAAAQRQVEFDKAIGGAGPQLSHTQLPVPGKDFVLVFRGVFPFVDGSDRVDRLFVVLADGNARVS